ncbi:MAG: threonylcarbamoyl-AMP synthase [Candidatus Kerfeldbacteria bacterium]|nr:threonylcarbamoyl-AMP synthase [Candidatus Kerfeldbacteria bacterium]
MSQTTILPKSVKIIPYLRQLLKIGEVVAAPTETAYGLLADALNPRAVARVQKIKGREPPKPIALVASDLRMVKRYFRMTRSELRMANYFWPGPLTLLLKPKYKFRPAIMGRGGLVGVRIPGNAWLRRLVLATNVPLTATSANRAGRNTAYTLLAVRRAFKSRGLKYIVDGGNLPPRLTSTVVKVDKDRLEILRPGAVSQGRLNKVLKLKSQ